MLAINLGKDKITFWHSYEPKVQLFDGYTYQSFMGVNCFEILSFYHPLGFDKHVIKAVDYCNNKTYYNIMRYLLLTNKLL